MKTAFENSEPVGVLDAPSAEQIDAELGWVEPNESQPKAEPQHSVNAIVPVLCWLLWGSQTMPASQASINRQAEDIQRQYNEDTHMIFDLRRRRKPDEVDEDWALPGGRKYPDDETVVSMLKAATAKRDNALYELQRSIPTRSISRCDVALRVIAAAYQISPELLDHQSFRELGDRIGVRKQTLAKWSTQFRDTFGIVTSNGKSEAARESYRKKAREMVNDEEPSLL